MTNTMSRSREPGVMVHVRGTEWWVLIQRPKSPFRPSPRAVDDQGAAAANSVPSQFGSLGPILGAEDPGTDGDRFAGALIEHHVVWKDSAMAGRPQTCSTVTGRSHS